jgi:hypothetical protein
MSPIGEVYATSHPTEFESSPLAVTSEESLFPWSISSLNHVLQVSFRGPASSHASELASGVKVGTTCPLGFCGYMLESTQNGSM